MYGLLKWDIEEDIFEIAWANYRRALKKKNH